MTDVHLWELHYRYPYKTADCYICLRFTIQSFSAYDPAVIKAIDSVRETRRLRNADALRYRSC